VLPSFALAEILPAGQLPTNQAHQMNENYHSFYQHSGKFGFHGPLLAILAAVGAGYPLGILYAYLIKWIPFIYLNFFITVGYGLVFGFMTGPLLKFAKVRSGVIALLTGLAVGLGASYLSWNGFVQAMVKESPALITPGQGLEIMKFLYENGSWGIGFSSSSPITGIPLAIVWLAEAGIIIGLITLLAYGAVARTPFCEQHECWLDEEKTIDKLDAFRLPDHIAALQAGNIAPLEQARPRVPASGSFARLTLRHSARCDDFCTLSIENVSVSLDEDGKQKEETESIMTNLLVPKTMFEYLAQFEHASARPVAGS
jgi:hypothetical protein